MPGHHPAHHGHGLYPGAHHGKRQFLTVTQNRENGGAPLLAFQGLHQQFIPFFGIGNLCFPFSGTNNQITDLHACRPGGGAGKNIDDTHAACRRVLGHKDAHANRHCVVILHQRRVFLCRVISGITVSRCRGIGFQHLIQKQITVRIIERILPEDFVNQRNFALIIFCCRFGTQRRGFPECAGKRERQKACRKHGGNQRHHKYRQAHRAPGFHLRHFYRGRKLFYRHAHGAPCLRQPVFCHAEISARQCDAKRILAPLQAYPGHRTFRRTGQPPAVGFRLPVRKGKIQFHSYLTEFFPGVTAQVSVFFRILPVWSSGIS